MNGSSRSPIPAVLVWLGLGLLALAGLWLLIAAWEEGMSGGRDFVQDYAAVVKIGAGRNPYEPYNDVTQQLFGGPPHRGPLYSFHAPTSLPLLVWLLPFARLWGYPGAFLAWGAVSVAALWAVCWLTLRALGVGRPALVGLLGAFALMLLPAVRESYEEGQLNVVVAAGMVGCWAARRAGRPILGGVLLGVGFALKPIPGLFFLYYAWRRDWRLVVAAAATVVLLAVIGVGLAGLDGTRLWATVNYPSHAGVWPGYPDNASVRGFFTRLFGPSEWRPRPPYPLPYATLALWTVCGGLLAVAALAAVRSATAPARPDDAPRRSPIARVRALIAAPPLAPADPRGDLEVAALTALTLLVTPIVWPHYYVVLVMPVAVLTAHLGRAAFGSPSGDEAAATSPAIDKAPIGDEAAIPDGARTDGSGGGRHRLVAAVALAVLLTGAGFLFSAEYIEPFRGSGGRMLAALLAVYAAALVALAGARRDRSPTPDALAEHRGAIGPSLSGAR